MYQDRWYQTEAVDSIGPYYNAAAMGEPIGNPLIGLPTGTGKSLVSARINQMIARYFPWHRGLNLTHVKELVEQNSTKLLQVWNNAPIGILSAGLKRKDVAQPIIFGGIQTAINKVMELGHRDYLLIDEAHLVGDKESSMYLELIDGLREVNPKIIVMGLSATLYRMRMGSLTDGGIFTATAYDLTNISGFNRLLDEGYISPLFPQPTNTQIDTSQVRTIAGEFAAGQLEEAADAVTEACVDEAIEKAWDRQCWLAFATGKKHAIHVAEVLNSKGISAAAVYSGNKRNDEFIKAFKRGEIRCLVNYNKLTTGFDHPPINFILMLRPTKSPGLWVQMLGRGTRPYDGRYANQYIPGFEYIKDGCLVLDFGGNSHRLGPINDPVLPRKPGEKGGDVPIKICESCGTYNHASARFCCKCKTEFPLGGSGIFMQSGTAELIRGVETPDVRYVDVSHVLYSLVNKNNVPPMMRVSYICGIAKFDEIICLEHNTAAKHFAHEWWRARYGDVPKTTSQGLDIAHRGLLPTPRKLKVWVNKKPYPQVLAHEY